MNFDLNGIYGYNNIRTNIIRNNGPNKRVDVTREIRDIPLDAIFGADSYKVTWLS
jgi:hypothetical protein